MESTHFLPFWWEGEIDGSEGRRNETLSISIKGPILIFGQSLELQETVVSSSQASAWPPSTIWSNKLERKTMNNICKGEITMYNICVASYFCLSTIFTDTDDPKMLSYITRHLLGGGGVCKAGSSI